MELTVRAAVPVEVNVSARFAVVFTVTFPKLIALALSASEGVAGTPVPLRSTFSGFAPESLLTIVIIPVAGPLAEG